MKKKASGLGVKRYRLGHTEEKAPKPERAAKPGRSVQPRRGTWQLWEVELLEDVSLTLVEVSKRTGRKLGSVYSEASVRKIGGRVQGRPRDPAAKPKGKMHGPRKPQKRAPSEAVRLLTETSLPYTAISELTGVDRESLRKAAYYHGVANRGQPKGEEAHRWRGGKGTKKRLQAAGYEWDAIRLAVLERDGYSCQDCRFTDLTGSRLHVHHVIPWRLRRVNDPAWLVTLCLACHGKRPEHYWEEIPESVLLVLAGRWKEGELPA